MRILHITDRLTDRGGAYVHLLGVLAQQAALDQGQGGNDLHLAVGCVEQNVELPCPVSVHLGLDARQRQETKLDPLVAEFAPDIIHLHTVVNPAVLEWAAERGNTLITIQDHRVLCPGQGKLTLNKEVCGERLSRETCAGCFEDERYFADILALTQLRLDAVRRLPVVVLSEYMRGELVQAGVPAENVTVIPPFVWGLAPPAHSTAPPCVLFVGRLAEAKGVRDAVQAWRLAQIDLPLIFAGTGPLRAALESDGFEVLGWLGRPVLADWVRNARALVMPSRWQEPFGIAGLEALSLGTPVVAWDSGGVHEWHPGDGLVPWGDVAGLAGTLQRLVGQRARPPQGFEPETLNARLMAIYNDLAVKHTS